MSGRLKSNGSAQRLDAEFKRALAEARSESSALAAITKLRQQADAMLLYRISGKFALHQGYRSLVLKAPFPKSFSELQRTPAYYRADYMRELGWLTGLLAINADKIGKYIELKEKYEYNVLSATPDKVLLILDECESTLGVSLWSVDNRLTYLSANSGYSEKNSYAKSLYKDSPSVIHVIISWLNFRTGGDVSNSEIDRMLNELTPLTQAYHYIIHFLNARFPSLNGDVAGLILQEFHEFPVIDKYETLLSMLQAFCASNTIKEDERIFTLEMLTVLSGAISDPRLMRLRTAFGDPTPVAVFDEHFIGMLDKYSEGYYKAVLNCKLANGADVVSIEKYNLVLRSRLMVQEVAGAASNAASIANAIEADLRALMEFGEEGVEARRRLQNLVLSHCNSTWASALSLILLHQTRDERVFGPSVPQTVHSLRLARDQPFLAFGLPTGACAAYAAAAQRAFPQSANVAVLSFLLHGNPIPTGVIATERLKRLSAVREARIGNFNGAIVALEEIGRLDALEPVQSESALFLVHCYLATGRIAEASDHAASLYIKSRYFAAVLPIRELVNAILKEHDLPIGTSKTRGRLSVAIIFDAYSRNISSDHDTERADAYKDALRVAGVRHASELPGMSNRFPRDELLYFLHNVCVPDVLDQSLNLENTRAVENERAAILVALANLAPDRPAIATEYKDELREILTKQVVRETTLRLDQSKIYVNVDGIRRIIDSSMREDWNIYKLMIMNDTADELLDSIEKIVASATGEKVMAIRLNSPLSQRRSLFTKMVLNFKEQFTSNKEFGLNSNLSTNIRHGYVLRELRGPLLGRNLITNKDSESGTYNLNWHWLERVDVSRREALADMLSRFSANVDGKIENVNRSLLRIRSEKNPDGLFDYGIIELEISALERKARQVEQYDEFMAFVVGKLWDITQSNLKRVRDVLLQQTFSELSASLDELDSELRCNGYESEVPSLASAVTLAKSELRSAVERVVSWFTLASANDYQDFDLEIAFRAGIETVRAYHRNVEIKSDYRANQTVMMRGWCLPMFARLFFMILDNAAIHGGRGRTTLYVSMEVEACDQSLFIRAVNDLPDDEDEDKLGARIAVINTEYGQERAIEMLGEEGGSGYPKIWKLLKTDLARQHELRASLDDRNFVVEIIMNAQDIVLCES